MTDISFDKQDQLDTVQAGLLPGEVAIAIYDSRSSGVGFVGLTDGRVILNDNSFVGGKSALTSLPYRCIQNISYLADKSMWGKFASSSVVSINPNVSDSQFGDLVSVRPTDVAVQLWHFLERSGDFRQSRPDQRGPSGASLVNIPVRVPRLTPTRTRAGRARSWTGSGDSPEHSRGGRAYSDSYLNDSWILVR